MAREIYFGSVYIPTNHGEEDSYLVTSIEDQGSFFSAPIKNIDTDSEELGFSGTEIDETFSTEMGRWPIERIITAELRAYGDNPNPETIEKVTKLYQERAQNSSRSIK